MSRTIPHPERKHPEPYQHDLNPDASKGLNYGKESPPVPKRSAFDIKRLHEMLDYLSADELKQIRVLGKGARLETKAAYLKLTDDPPVEFHANGDEEVEEDGVYVAKSDVSYELWNRLRRRQEPNRARRVQGRSGKIPGA